VYGVLVGKTERDHWQDPDVDGKIISRLIFRKCEVGVGVWTGLRWLTIGTGCGHLRMR
jgi:hypothetical protein